MQKLSEGYAKFHAEAEAAMFPKLSEGQSPQALVIACSDGRLSPTKIMGAQLGDIFVIRNAGNIVPPATDPVGAEAASVEFGITALSVPDIIVLGHSRCGAMQGLLKPDACRHMPMVCAWLEHSAPVRQTVAEHHAELSADAQQDQAARENLILQLRHLHSYPVVEKAVSAGKLRLHAWYFELHTGVMYEYDEEQMHFAPLLDAHHAYGRQHKVTTTRHRPKHP